MLFTYFAPGNPPPGLLDAEHAAVHAQQTKPTSHLVADSLLDLFDWVAASTRPGRKGDAGYIVAGDCRASRSGEAIGPVSFALIDLDDAEPDWVQLEEYTGFAWTTASHTTTEPHWRVVIPFKEPIAHGPLACPFAGGHIRNRSQPAFLPTGSPEWRVLGGTKTLDPVERPKAENKPRATGSVQISELDERIASELASVWKHGCTGDQAFGALGGWARSRGVSDSRIANVAARVAELTQSTHPDPERRATQEGCTLGRKRLQERLSIDADLGAVALTLDDVETLLAASVPGFEQPVEVRPGRFIRGPELAADVPPVEWLIKDMEICPGRPPLLSAESGGGKTIALQSIALSVATGRPVFDRFACTKTPVLHISRDSSIGAVRRRYKKLAKGMGIDLAQTDITVFPHELRVVDVRGNFDRKGLKEVMDEAALGYGLVIMDSVVAICAGLEENNVEIADPLRHTFDEKKVWWWAHHNGKNGGYRGSSALKGVAGVWWTMDEEYNWSTLKRSEDTEGGKLPLFKTSWEQDSDGGERIVAIDLAPEPISREETTLQIEQRIRADVVAFLMAEADGLGASAKRVEASVRGKGDTIRGVLKTLAYEGVLEHTGQRYILKSRRG